MEKQGTNPLSPEQEEELKKAAEGTDDEGIGIFDKMKRLRDALVGADEAPDEPYKSKTLHNTCVDGAKKNVSDLVVFGDGDMFKLLSKASSQAEGWMKSTKAMNVTGGVVIQVTTQQRNIDGTYAVAEAVTYVPGNKVVAEGEGYKLVRD
jgi:hypothetical protein